MKMIEVWDLKKNAQLQGLLGGGTNPFHEDPGPLHSDSQDGIETINPA